MRKLLLTTTALAMAMGFAAPASAEFQSRNIKVSNGINQDHPVGNGLKAVDECLQQTSNGQMKITAFWGGALGGDLQATQALRSGVQEAVISSSSPLVGLVPALGVFDLPFLFATDKEADAVMDGEFGEMLNAKLAEAGLVNLAYWENGFRNLTNSVRPVTKWEDVSGLKVRVMQNNIFLDTFQNLGANATPMAFGEIFSGLETKAIDAQENPYVTIDTSKFYEVQKYVTETKHAYTPFLFLFSKAIFDTYSPEEQAALKKCAVVGRDVERKVIRELNAKSLEKIKAAGIEANVLSPEEQARIREKSLVVYEKHKAEIGPEVVDGILAKLGELRK
ncbi:TRAP transporter substrate-binding protein [Rhizobium sp. NFR03]|uniref:TRAP transporter substrate-binding protein n=1 Tax=Rhizobium sp. NFR03 TaxID=1566263 RepID=UPI0008B58B9C|nr:TRAP transporter substrate-binding protein [Rhizobium sp. NFR03]SES44757.1 tripartite ATP-independent transporter solute receptor, DctP family [Rhizobium sp. NFR03]